MNQKISGLYKGFFISHSENKAKRIEIELRVDVDGNRSLNVISGDFYSNSERTGKYLSSFIFQRVKKTEIPSKGIILIGEKGKFSPNSDQFTDIKIRIPAYSYSPIAALKWTNGLGSELKCSCKHVSKYFRTVYQVPFILCEWINI